MDIYMRLSYDAYKEMERQIKAFDDIESAHVSVDGFYHKSFRLKFEGLTIEFHGPTVKN